MYKCQLCNTYYDLSKDHENEIGKVNESNPVIRTVIVCPGCRKKRIIGGELSYDEIDDTDIIMMFGHDYVEEKHKELLCFEAVIEKVPDYDIEEFIKIHSLKKLNDQEEIIKIVSNHFNLSIERDDIIRVIENRFRS